MLNPDNTFDSSAQKSENEFSERASRLSKNVNSGYSRSVKIPNPDFVSTPEPTPTPSPTFVFPTLAPVSILKGVPFFFASSFNNVALRGYIYLPLIEQENTDEEIIVDNEAIVLFHGKILSDQQSLGASLGLLQNVLNGINIKNKVLVSFAYPQQNLLVGDNLFYAEAALSWVQSLQQNFYNFNLKQLFLLGHADGGYLAFRLNQLYPTDGVILNTPSYIDLVVECETDQNLFSENSQCKLIEENFGNVGVNSRAYFSRSLLNFATELKSRMLIIQGLNDDSLQIQATEKLKTAILNCTDCEDTSFLFVPAAGNLAFFQSIIAIERIKNFLSNIQETEQELPTDIPVPTSTPTETETLPEPWNVNIFINNAGQTFSIDFRTGDFPQFLIDWGDGTTTLTNQVGVITRAYQTTGFYTVKIYGNFVDNGNIRLGSTLEEKATVLSVDPLPEINGFIFFDYTFEDCTNLTSIPEGLFSNMPQARTFIGTFKGCVGLNSLQLNLFSTNTQANSFDLLFNQTEINSNDYSELLIELATFNLNENVLFDGGNSFYEPFAQSSVQTLISRNWTITDNGLVPIPTEPPLLNTWDIEIQTTNANDTFGIQLAVVAGLSLIQVFNINITIDWGDNSPAVTYNSTGVKTHFYLNPGNYTVRITGSFNENTGCIRLGTNNKEKQKVISTSVIPFIPGLTNFTNTFLGCTSLTSVLENLFINNPEITTFSACFRGCTSLTSIPENLFASNPNVAVFGGTFGDQGCFSGCTSLTSIPENLFANNSAATLFRRCFSTCTSLTTIPSNLFASCSAATDFTFCFLNCVSLTSLPAQLFSNNTTVIIFQGCFGNCTSLLSIPSQLFENNINASGFSTLFTGCSSLISIPSGLFANNTVATSFINTFANCFALTSIPTGLFDSNTAASAFPGCFQGCTSLTTIPAGLFTNNVAANNFNTSFNRCASLSTVPSGLFANNTAVVDFGACFAQTTLTTTSYSNLLINMASNAASRNNNVPFHGGNSKYNTAGELARNVLLAKSWVFTDEGLE